MRIFFYKTLLVAFIFFIIFKVTFGLAISNFERKIQSFSSKKNIERIKDEIRKEIKVGLLIKISLSIKKMLNLLTFF